MTGKRIVLDLPWPPSLNAIWRSGKKRVYRNPKYNRWAAQAGLLAKAYRYPMIIGRFKAKIILNPPTKREIDVDNRVKVLLDLAQAVGLIENDKKCRLLVVSYGEVTPTGSARMILSPMTCGVFHEEHKI